MTEPQAPDAPVLLVTVADAVATITLNRPAARNALNLSLRTALGAAVRELNDREDVAVLVLTGADPAFCAGMDLRAVLDNHEQALQLLTTLADITIASA